MSVVYFAADLHFGHKGVSRFRSQFKSEAEHNEVVLDNILTTVNKRDTLWLLGDIAFNEEGFDYFIEITKHVGSVKVVLGNHDWDNIGMWAYHASSVYGATKYKKCWLTHIPIHPDELRGGLNVYGHCHNKPIVGDDRYYCVSLEQIDYKPIKFQDIIGTFRERGVIK